MDNVYLRGTVRAAIGLAICALGTHLAIQANVGLAPWDAFSMGVAGIVGCSYGTVVVVTGMVILLFALLLKEKIGIGTLLDIAIVGKTVDFYHSLGLVPEQQNLAVGIAMLTAAQLVLATGIWIYMSAAVGCGPRDALMMALSKRVKRLSVGGARGVMEGTALLVGWLLGAKVGIGTVIAVFGLSFCIQLVFAVVHFDAEGLEHKGLGDMARDMRF